MLICGLGGSHKIGQRVHVPAKKVAIDPQAMSFLWNSVGATLPSSLSCCRTFSPNGHSSKYTPRLRVLDAKPADPVGRVSDKMLSSLLHPCLAFKDLSGQH